MGSGPLGPPGWHLAVGKCGRYGLARKSYNGAILCCAVAQEALQKNVADCGCRTIELACFSSLESRLCQCQTTASSLQHCCKSRTSSACLDNQCLTSAWRAQVLKKKAKAVKGKPAGRMLTKTEPCASFFNFFSPPAVPENPNEADEDEMEELQQAMEEDYELGCAPGRPEYPLLYTGRGLVKCSRPWRRTTSSGARRGCLNTFCYALGGVL